MANMKVGILLTVVFCIVACERSKSPTACHATNCDFSNGHAPIDHPNVTILSVEVSKSLTTILLNDEIDEIIPYFDELIQECTEELKEASPPADAFYKWEIRYRKNGQEDLLVLYFATDHQLLLYDLSEEAESKIEAWHKSRNEE